MRFVVDECTGPFAARWLRNRGHDVVSIYDEMRGIDDDRLLELSNSTGSVLITNDKDFGDKVFRDRRQHHGVVLLRLADERRDAKVAALTRLLASGVELEGRFVVVTESSIRVSAR